MSDDEIRGLWRLYDSESKLFFNNLNLDQLLKIVADVSPDDMQYWHVCRDTEVEWYPLEQRLSSIKKLTGKGATDRPTGIVSLNSFVNQNMVDTKTSGIKLDKKVEMRKIKRLSKKVDVFIDVGEEILFAETKDISVVSIKLSKRFPIKYRDKYYPITIKTRPSITLRCKPLVGEKENMRGAWNIVLLDPNFNLTALANFLKS